MKKRKMLYLTIMVLILSVWLFDACSPVRQFMTWRTYSGTNNFDYKIPSFDSSKKTIIIVADNEGTEIFDMLAPYYLFNVTGKANVYIVAEKKYPIIVRKGFFLLPQFSFAQFDSSNIKPDVIVIPNLSAMDAKHQNPITLNWINKYYSKNIKMLSICDGALTSAATGIYNGEPLTAHSSDYEDIKKQYSKPNWVKNVSVTQSENLYSTAGVSNAVEGSLTVIKKIFGVETMLSVQKNINYPHSKPKIEHQSIAINLKNKMTIGKKVILKKNKKIGMLLQDGINEFELAAIMDTYNRTFPASIESYVANGTTITSKFGLTILPTGDIQKDKIDELHIIDNNKISDQINQKNFELILYNNIQNQYIINTCLERISEQYGTNYKNTVKLLLDYN